MEFTFVYTGIRATNLDRSIDFYEKVLGMKLLDRVKVPQRKGEFATLKSEGSDNYLEINWYADDSPLAAPYRIGEELDHLAFHVEDLDGALEYLEERGYPMALGPLKSEHARWAYVKDPDGIYVELFEAREKHQEAEVD